MVYKAPTEEVPLTGIEVHDLAKTYRRGLMGVGGVRALDGVTLSIRPGEAFGIIGPNGAGKTTFLGCLLGFLHPDSGQVTIDGREVDDLEVRAATGYLPERMVLDRWMTGIEFLEYHHALARLPASRRGDESRAALERVGLDAEAGARPIRKYSRGMLQRIGIAQAMLGEPRYLFLDEPVSGVDPAGVVLIRRLLMELKGRGVTIVLNSHQLEQVERVCDRVAFVNRGKVEAIETLEAGAAAARVLEIRTTAAPGAAPLSTETLAPVAARARVELLEVKGPVARFSVADDEAAARLLRALIEAGVPVVEASPEEGRLERLFLAERGGAP